MKVILQRDMPKVGHEGDVVVVKDGYARNYLIPRKYAVHAIGGALKSHQARVDQVKVREAKTAGDAKAAAAKVDGLVVQVIAKVGSGTKLYGSVTTQDVVDRIKAATGVEVDKRRLGLVEPIKSLGTYKVNVRFSSDSSASVTVDVTTEEELERRKNAPPEPVAEVVEEASAPAAEEVESFEGADEVDAEG